LPFGPADWRVVIETARLCLVPLTRANAASLFGILHDPGLHEHIGGEPLDEHALEERYALLEQGGPADGSAVWANWVVRLRASRAAIGVVQASVREDGADLAWVIGRRWQRTGYASEAAAAMASWLAHAGVGVMRAHIHPANEASARVADRAGLRRTHRTDRDGEVIWESRPSTAG
jgi:RimJ/RimL family protein N-acetyltransferase